MFDRFGRKHRVDMLRYRSSGGRVIQEVTPVALGASVNPGEALIFNNAARLAQAVSMGRVIPTETVAIEEHGTLGGRAAESEASNHDGQVVARSRSRCRELR